MNEKNSFRKNVDDLLKRAGWSDSDEYRLIGLEGGKNNKVFKVQGSSEDILLKRFYKREQEGRNRQFSEYSFAQFAWNRGVRCIPRPICYDEKRNICVYEYLEGRPFTVEDIDDRAVDEAIHFFSQINYPGVFHDAGHLPLAADACFSLKDHFQHVDKRIENLREVGYGKVDLETFTYIREDLPKLWKGVRKKASYAARLSGYDLEEKLETSNWCLSPSDFGFHNALLMPSKEIRFFDFEYAGWDDPAKTVCDFFCQVALPVPEKYYDKFSKAIGACVANDKKFVHRTRLLFPIYRLKWCLIVMNEFLTSGAERREFATGKTLDWKMKKKQFEKSKSLAMGIAKDLNL